MWDQLSISECDLSIPCPYSDHIVVTKAKPGNLIFHRQPLETRRGRRLAKIIISNNPSEPNGYPVHMISTAQKGIRFGGRSGAVHVTVTCRPIYLLSLNPLLLRPEGQRYNCYSVNRRAFERTCGVHLTINHARCIAVVPYDVRSTV